MRRLFSETSLVPARPAPAKPEQQVLPWKEDRTFANFLVGGSNNFAHQVSRTFAEGEGPSTIVLYGLPGVGKTHLLNAIAEHLRARGEDGVEVLSAERFLNEVISCMRFGRMSEFREKYRNQKQRMFILDGVEVFVGKEKSGLELAQTLEFLNQQHDCRVAIAASDLPVRLGLPSRLAALLVGALSVPVHAPDKEMRSALLVQKCAERGVELPPSVSDYMATRVPGFRQVESVVRRLVAQVQFDNHPFFADRSRERL
ncbi:MAG: DnaA/Hda family protein [Patescibacteria group bacterium]